MDVEPLQFKALYQAQFDMLVTTYVLLTIIFILQVVCMKLMLTFQKRN